MKVSRTNISNLPATMNGIMAIWLVLVSLGLAGCAGGASASPVTNDKPLVAASIAPLADFTHQVGGDHVQVITLVPPGASPHTF